MTFLSYLYSEHFSLPVMLLFYWPLQIPTVLDFDELKVYYMLWRWGYFCSILLWNDFHRCRKGARIEKQISVYLQTRFPNSYNFTAFDLHHDNLKWSFLNSLKPSWLPIYVEHWNNIGRVRLDANERRIREGMKGGDLTSTSVLGVLQSSIQCSRNSVSATLPSSVVVRMSWFP